MRAVRIKYIIFFLVLDLLRESGYVVGFLNGHENSFDFLLRILGRRGGSCYNIHNEKNI